MPLYFFNVASASQTVLDEEGSVLPNLATAREEAVNVPLRVTNGMPGNGGLSNISSRAAASGQTGNLFEAASNGASAIYTRIDKGGFLITAKNAAPADADLLNGELGWWFDATPGASKVMFKGKTSGGTIVTGQMSAA